MRKLLFSLLGGLALAGSLQAQFSLTNVNTNYTENFNSLANTGVSSVLPQGWLLFESGSGPQFDQAYQADNGSLINGNVYSYGATGSNERAFGCIQSGSVIPTLGAAFTNNTGGVITGLVITYTGEMWRAGVANRNAADRLDFQYSLNATDLNSGTWVNVDALDLNSPNINTSDGPKDGNAAAFRTTLNHTLTGLSIPNGTTFFIRWTDFNIASNDDGLAIDDFTINAQGSGTGVPCIPPGGLPANLGLTPGNTSIAGAFTAAPGADGYLVCYSTNSTIGFTPFNGISYTAGQVLAGTTVGYVGQATSFLINGLNPSTTYYFFIFSLNGFTCGGGPIYSSSTLNGNVTTTSGSESGIPPGYYDIANGKTCVDLKNALKTRTGTNTNNQPVSSRDYGDLWGQYLISDVKPREVGSGSATTIWDIYSDNPNGPDPYNFIPGPVANGGQQDNGTNAPSEGILYNREHTVPLSWFGGNTSNPGPATDYFHIFPTDKWVNALRESFIFGEVSNPTTTTLNGSKLGPNSFAGLTGTAFEPIDEYKGDVARAFLYFVTRYQDNMPNYTGGTFGSQAFEQNAYPSVDINYLRLMLKWHNQDPVSQKERDRNAAGFAYQGNRNPFIDRPEFADLTWNASCSGLGSLPVSLLWFKGALKGSDVVLQWQAASETNFSRYEVERSKNGKDYKQVGTVPPGSSRSYQFTDDVRNLSGRVYYRLRMVDADGSSRYSAVYSLNLPVNLRFQLYPNPASTRVTIELGSRPFSGTLEIADQNGRVLHSQRLVQQSGRVLLPVSNLAAGRYMLRLRSAESGADMSLPFNVMR
jgi:endonuclease I